MDAKVVPSQRHGLAASQRLADGRSAPGGSRPSSARLLTRRLVEKAQQPRRVEHWSSSSDGGRDSSTGSKRKAARNFFKLSSLKLKPRVLLLFSFAFIEVVMVGVFLAALFSVRQCVQRNYTRSSIDTVGTLHEAVLKPLHVVEASIANSAYSKQIQAYLGGTGDAGSVDDLMKHWQEVHSLEFLVMVNATTDRVLRSANSKILPEDVFNPQGIVTAAHDAEGRSAWCTSVMPYDELISYDVTLYRGRDNDLQMAGYNHPYETKENGLVLWLATAVATYDSVTMEVLEEAEPEAYLVVGMLLNGKATLSSLLTQTLGGYAGIYAQLSNASDAAVRSAAPWTSISTSLEVIAQAKKKGQSSTVIADVVIKGFDASQAFDDRDAALNAVVARPVDDDDPGDVSTAHPYTFVGKQFAAFDHEGVVKAAVSPHIVLSRGIQSSNASDKAFETQMWLVIVLVLLLDAATLLLATSLFLAPLERMGKKVKAGYTVDINYLRALTKRTRFRIVIAAVAVFSMLTSGSITQQSIAHARRAVDNRSAAEPGVTQLAWRRSIDIASATAYATNTAATLLAACMGTADAELRHFADLRMLKMQSVQRIEIAAAVNASGHIVAAADTADVLGEQWDPAGVVSDTLDTGMGYTRVGLEGATTFKRFNSTLWQDKFEDVTTDSQLHPLLTGAEALVRYTSTPIFAPPNASEPTAPRKVVGVIVTCETVNGKTRIPETAAEIIDRGYSAVYYLNSTGHYVLASSVLQLPDDEEEEEDDDDDDEEEEEDDDGEEEEADEEQEEADDDDDEEEEEERSEYEVDVPLPSTHWLEPLRNDRTWLDNAAASVTSTVRLRKQRFIMSARCMTRPMYINSEGSNPSLQSHNGTLLTQCPVFLIHGMPWSTALETLRPAYAWQYTFLAVCAAKLLALGFLCYRAFLPFRKIVLQNKFVTASAAATSREISVDGRSKKTAESAMSIGSLTNAAPATATAAAAAAAATAAGAGLERQASARSGSNYSNARTSAALIVDDYESDVIR